MTGRPPEPTWTLIGAEYVTDENRHRVEAAIAALVWRAAGERVPATAGLAIRASIEKFRLADVQAIAVSHDLAPYALYGIDAAHPAGRLRVYILDRGTSAIALAHDLIPTPETRS